MEEHVTKRVGFIESLKLFWTNYFNFSDRSRRSEYWFWILWMAIFELIFSVLDALLKLVHITPPDSYFGLTIIFEIVTLIPLFAITTRRFHDTNRNIIVPAIYFVAYTISLVIKLFFPDQVITNLDRVVDIIMIIFGIYILVISFLQSDAGENKYGPEPVGQRYRNHSQA